VTVTVQVVLPPLQPPPFQPSKADPEAALAVKVTVAPVAKLAVQVLPQVRPAGSLVTVPLPAPFFEMVTGAVAVPEGVNMAIT